MEDPSTLKLALYDAAFFVKSRMSVYYQSSVMARLFREVTIAARSDEPVLITGESGSGKDLIARAIHKISRRAGGPFEPFN